MDSTTEVQTCGIHNTIGADGSMRSLDIPLAIGSRAEPSDGGWVVDLGTVHSGASSERHSEGVRVDVAVSWCVQTCQHLIDFLKKKRHYGGFNGSFPSQSTHPKWFYIQTLSILSRGKSSLTFSGPIKYCSVTCQCVRVIWYFISSTRAGEEAIRTLPGWWRPTACRGPW